MAGESNGLWYALLWPHLGLQGSVPGQARETGITKLGGGTEDCTKVSRMFRSTTYSKLGWKAAAKQWKTDIKGARLPKLSRFCCVVWMRNWVTVKHYFMYIHLLLRLLHWTPVVSVTKITFNMCILDKWVLGTLELQIWLAMLCVTRSCYLSAHTVILDTNIPEVSKYLFNIRFKWSDILKLFFLLI